jgi:hypothetical protein
MKVTRFLLSALLLGAMATTASAQGAVSLSWDTCAPIVVNKAIAPGTTASLYASVLGHDQPHQAYQVFVFLGSGNAGAIRDAWRFDAAGCQGSSFITIDHLAPAAVVKTCPTFQGPLASIQIKDYSFDAVTGKARAVLANTYPAGNFTQINPAVRYFLARFLFDHTFSVNGATTPGADCGGLEVAVCAHLNKTSWLSPAGVETQWAFGQEYVTANDAQNTSGCPGATPTVDKTWGSLKAQYKR